MALQYNGIHSISNISNILQYSHEPNWSQLDWRCSGQQQQPEQTHENEIKSVMKCSHVMKIAKVYTTAEKLYGKRSIDKGMKQRESNRLK